MCCEIYCRTFGLTITRSGRASNGCFGSNSEVGPLERHVRSTPDTVAKVESCISRIFGEILNREAIDDSDNLSRATEVAYEFWVGLCGPSDLYTKTAPAALRIFETFGKATFATLSPQQQTSSDPPRHVRFVPMHKVAARQPAETGAWADKPVAGLRE